jgi:Family of unknown function (DUF6807)
MTALLLDDDDTALTVHYGDVELLRYVYRPDDAQLESPRPYVHPLRTLAGDSVTVYRPHDHVWHKGLALSLPNVGDQNFWGGVTWVRDEGYRQLPNNGTMRHVAFDTATVAGEVLVDERLDWVTEDALPWCTESRRLQVAVEADSDAWVLGFATRFENVSGRTIVMGSPTTEGRPNAGYGGLFWRGPRSFTGGVVHVPAGSGKDELMGVRTDWMGFTGVHDGLVRPSTIVMVDAPDNPGHPTQWFVRSTPFAALCPAPFFDTEAPIEPGAALSLRYAVVIADGDGSRAATWADAGRTALARWAG